MISLTERHAPAGIGSWSVDEYEPRPDQPEIQAETRHLRDVLTFETPRRSFWIDRIASLVNRNYYLRLGAMHFGSVEPVLPPTERAKLREIPPEAGNMLVGPHPGPLDAHLMFYLFSASGHVPALFLMAAETYYGGTPFRRWFLNRLGVMPVARGRPNPEAIGVMTQRLADGCWAGIFPEGDVYFSREIMPMEYGALRIGVEAALIAQRQAPAHPRPVQITPFAFAYRFVDQAKTLSRIRNALAGVEARPEVFGKAKDGEVIERLRAIADKLLEFKAAEYGVPPERWQDTDRFERGRKLQVAVLGDLEERYLGARQEGFARRRALKVRMHLFERLTHTDLSEAEREALHRDVQKTREIVLTVPFTRDYVSKYGDIEMWVEYLRRFHTVLGIGNNNFGPQQAVFKVLDPIDMHALARDYQAIGDPSQQREFLFHHTDNLRTIVQAGVDEIQREAANH